MSTPRTSNDHANLSPDTSDSAASTKQTSYEGISRGKGLGMVYLAGLDGDSRKWGSTSSIGNMSTAAQIDEDEGRSELGTPTIGSRPGTPPGTDQWSEDEESSLPDGDEDHTIGQEPDDKNSESAEVKPPQVNTQARTHPLGGKGAEWKGTPLDEPYQKHLDAHPDEQLGVPESDLPATPVSRSSSNVSSSEHTETPGSDSGALSRSSTGVPSNVAADGHETDRGSEGVSRSSTATTNAISTAATHGHGPVDQDTHGVSRSATAASNSLSIAATQGHDPDSGVLSRSSTQNWSHIASQGHSGDDYPHDAPHGASSPSSFQPSSLNFSAAATDGHPTNDARGAMSPVTEDTGSLRLSQPSTNRRSNIANDGHSSEESFSDATISSSAYTMHDRRSEGNGISNSSSDIASDPSIQKAPFPPSIPQRPSPVKDLSTTADAGHSDLSIDYYRPDPSNSASSLPSIDDTSSSDGSDQTHSANSHGVIDKVKGEVKVLGGKIARNEDKVAEGKRLLGKV